MRLFKLLLAIVLILALISSGTVYAEGRHWVYDELAAFKQVILPFADTIPVNGIISKDEWEAVSTQVFDETKLDQPILIHNWAALLKLVMDIPKDRLEQFLHVYVYGLADGDTIKREDAVGGMVKLMTLNYISGSATYEEIKDSEALKDMKEVDSRQEMLVRTAYHDGALDGTVKDYFRPKDRLTNAEAVSMLYRVVKKHDIHPKVLIALGQNHWAGSEIKQYMRLYKGNEALTDFIENSIYGDMGATGKPAFDKPVPVKEWNDLLMGFLTFDSSKYDQKFLESYTFGLSKDGYISRGAAVAGLMKLGGLANIVQMKDASEQQRNNAAAYFSDYDRAFDMSKLAIAYNEGMLKGCGDQTFQPERLLTNGEAAVLAARIYVKYVGIKAH